MSGAHARDMPLRRAWLRPHLVLHLTAFRSQRTNRNRANRRGKGLNNWLVRRSKLSLDERPVRRISQSERGNDIQNDMQDYRIPHIAWAHTCDYDAIA